MDGKRGWEKVLADPCFQSVEGSIDRETQVRLLAIIGEDLYEKKVSFSIENPYFSLPKEETRKEAIGRKATMLKESLTEHHRNTEEVVSETTWLDFFLKRPEFQRYVLNFLDFLISLAKKELPRSERGTVSLEEQARETKRENVKELQEVFKKATEAQEAAKEARLAAESVIPNMLTTLGVFVAIIIAVVACYLSVLLAQHFPNDIAVAQSGLALPQSMAMLLLMGHVLLNIIFLLLYLISKMSNHTLACNCPVGNQMDCGQCLKSLREQCHWGNKLWLRYPYVVALNGVFILGYLGFGLWYFFQTYLGDCINTALKAGAVWAIRNVSIVIAIVLVVVGLSLYFGLLRNPRRKEKKAQDKETRRTQKTAKAEKERRYLQKLRRSVEQSEHTVKEMHNKMTDMEQTIEDQRQQLEEMRKRLEECSHQNADTLEGKKS